MIVDLTKVLQSLLLPPGLLLVLVALALLLALLGRRRIALGLACGGCALVFVLSLGPVSNLLLRSLEGRHPPLPPLSVLPEPGELIVLLGGGTTRSPETAEGDALSPSAARRALYAASLQRRLGLPIITTGGLVVPRSGRRTEAAVAAALLEELGVPAGLILQEGDSRTTWENAARVRELFRPRRVVLVTSAYHMSRAVTTFERHGMEVLPAPTDYLAEELRSFLDWLPSADFLRSSLVALREHLGIAAYRLLYRARGEPN